jgi:CRP/FNR family transcriptional regulator
VLAGQLGVTSETLSRTLARFRREGLIEVAGARIRVIAGQGLRAYAEL